MKWGPTNITMVDAIKWMHVNVNVNMDVNLNTFSTLLLHRCICVDQFFLANNPNLNFKYDVRVCVSEYSFFHLGKDSFHFGTLVVLKSFSVPSFVIFYSLIRQFYFLPLFITRDTELTNRIQWFWRIDLEYEDSENVYSFVCMAFVRPNMQKWQTSFLD